MKKWKAILTNGEEYAETGNISAWRELSEYCKCENLKIESLLWNEKEVDSGTDYYFIIYQVTQSINSKIQQLLMGVGALKNNKAYIDWYHLPNKEKAYRIVLRNRQEFDCYYDIAIPRVK